MLPHAARHFVPHLTLVFALSLLGAPSLTAAEATLAVVNARVWTGDADRPRAEAISTDGSRILAVGSNQGISVTIGRNTVLIDGRGATLLPGFIDAHLHVMQYRESRHQGIYLRFRNTKAALLEAVKSRVASLPEGEWILGADFDDAVPPRNRPSRRWVDPISPRHPVWLRSLGGRCGLANAVALKLAGIDPASVRDGILRGSLMSRVDAALVEANSRQARRLHPAPVAAPSGFEDDDRVIESALRRAAAAGITSVHHTGGWTDLMVFQRLHRERRLPVRIYACTPLGAWTRLRDHIAVFGRGDEWLRWDCLKGFGAMSDAEAYSSISAAARAGIQVMVHVSPQPGLPALLDIYARVKSELPLSDPRFRIEHAHTMPPEILRAFRAAGAIASIQPPLLADFDKRAGGTPVPYEFPWRDALDAPITVAFGTDSVATSSLILPLASIQMALQRQGPHNTAITLDEALTAYTSGGAFAEFAETQKGRLRPGMLADFVLLDADIHHIPVAELHSVSPVLTVAGGQITYRN